MYNAVNPSAADLLRLTPGIVYLATIDKDKVSIDLTLETDVAGSHLAISGDGSRLAVRSGTGSTVRVYEVVNGKLSLSDHRVGRAKGGQVALSKDGNMMALSSETLSNFHGHVEISRYDAVAREWILAGSIDGTGGGFGWSTAFSYDGNRLAVSSPFQGGGVVRVYQRLAGGEWTQLGQDVFSDGPTDRFGQSIDLDGDGSSLVVGAPGAPAGGSSRGFVQVFDLNHRAQWIPRGDKMVGTGDLDFLGGSVQITENGYRVAASGSPIPRGFFVYDWEGVHWGLYGSDTFGGLGLAMTRDGSRVVGGSLDYGKSETIGEVELFDVDVDATKTAWPTQPPGPSPVPSSMPSREPRPSPEPSSMPSSSPTAFRESVVVLSGCRCSYLGDCIDDEIKSIDKNLTVCLQLENRGLTIDNVEYLNFNQGENSIRRIQNGTQFDTFTLSTLTGNHASVMTRLSAIDCLIASLRDNKFTVSGSVIVSNRDGATQEVLFAFDIKLQRFSFYSRFIVSFVIVFVALTCWISYLQKWARVKRDQGDLGLQKEGGRNGIEIQRTLDVCWGTDDSSEVSVDISQIESEDCLVDYEENEC